MAPKRKEATKEVESAPQVQTKKSKRDPATEKLNQQLKEVSGALDSAPVSKEVKKMLTEILPCSLGEFSDQRSEFQTRVIGEVAGILGDVEVSLNKMINDARSERDGATSTKPVRDKEAQEATAKLQSAKEERQRLKVALANKALAFRAATAAVVEAEEAKKLDAQKAQEAAKQKEHFEAALETLKVLGTISPEEAEASEKQDELVKCLKKYKFEESILIALPAALAKAPDARGQFDLMAITQLETDIGKKIAEQESVLVAARPGQEKCEAAVFQAQERLSEVRTEQKLAAKAFDAADKEQTACEAAATAALAAVRSLTTSSKRLEEAVYSAEVELELFQQGPIEAFNTLRERTTPAPTVEAPVEAPAAEEEVPAPTAATEHAMETQEVEVPAVAVC